MKKIQLTKGKFAVVDDEDYDFLSKIKWHARKDTNNYYAENKRDKITLRMHREIMKLKMGDKREIDHINGDGLDNRKENLRICTHKENTRNCKSAVGSSSKYKGVSWNKREKKWRIGIVVDNKHISFGSFDDEVEAALIYDIKVVEYFGEYSKLNFPNLTRHLKPQICQKCKELEQTIENINSMIGQDTPDTPTGTTTKSEDVEEYTKELEEMINTFSRALNKSLDYLKSQAIDIQGLAEELIGEHFDCRLSKEREKRERELRKDVKMADVIMGERNRKAKEIIPIITQYVKPCKCEEKAKWDGKMYKAIATLSDSILAFLDNTLDPEHHCILENKVSQHKSQCNYWKSHYEQANKDRMEALGNYGDCVKKKQQLQSELDKISEYVGKHKWLDDEHPVDCIIRVVGNITAESGYSREEIEHLKAEIDLLKSVSPVITLNAKVKELQAEISSYKKAEHESNCKALDFVTLLDQLKEKDGEMGCLSRSLGSANDEIIKLKAQLAEKDRKKNEQKSRGDESVSPKMGKK